MRIPDYIRKNFFVDLYFYFKNKYRIKYIVHSKTICITDVCYWEYDASDRPGHITKWCIENCQGRWEYIDDTRWGFSNEEDATHFKMVWGFL